MRVSRRGFLRFRLRPRIQGNTIAEKTATGKNAETKPPLSRSQKRALLLNQAGRFVARVDRGLCLGSAGQMCATCEESCPVEGAIKLDGFEPVINTSLCDGCGECERRCPAPMPAIRVVPEGL